MMAHVLISVFKREWSKLIQLLLHSSKNRSYNHICNFIYLLVTYKIVSTSNYLCKIHFWNKFHFETQSH